MPIVSHLIKVKLLFFWSFLQEKRYKNVHCIAAIVAEQALTRPPLTRLVQTGIHCYDGVHREFKATVGNVLFSSLSNDWNWNDVGPDEFNSSSRKIEMSCWSFDNDWNCYEETPAEFHSFIRKCLAEHIWQWLALCSILPRDTDTDSHGFPCAPDASGHEEATKKSRRLVYVLCGSLGKE